MDVNIIKDHNENGWITVIACDRWVQAKVYGEPSIFGVNDCRVSKLAIAKKGVHLLGIESGLNFFDNLDYHYDRVLDFHNDDLGQDDLDAILTWLNELPNPQNPPTSHQEAHQHVKRVLTVLGKEHMDWYDVQLARIWLAMAFDKIKEMDMEATQ